VAKAQRAEDELVVGSFMGAPKGKSASYQPAVSSPMGKSYLQERLASEAAQPKASASDVDSKGKQTGTKENGTEGYGTFSSIFPSFSTSRFAESRRRKNVQLPPGVTRPEEWLKDSGELKIEAKVWLANERTFLKWQHISVLLGGLAVGLYTAARGNVVTMWMGVAYTVIAICAGIWGWSMHWQRRRMIEQRSSKDFDNIIGPMVVSIALMVALIVNFAFQYYSAIERLNRDNTANLTLSQATFENVASWKGELL